MPSRAHTQGRPAKIQTRSLVWKAKPSRERKPSPRGRRKVQHSSTVDCHLRTCACSGFTPMCLAISPAALSLPSAAPSDSGTPLPAPAVAPGPPGRFRRLLSFSSARSFCLQHGRGKEPCARQLLETSRSRKEGGGLRQRLGMATHDARRQCHHLFGLLVNETPQACWPESATGPT